MRTWHWQAVLWLATFLALFSTARAQQGPPHIGYVYPAGGQRGTTFQVTVGGQHLTNAKLASFSGKGIKATMPGEIDLTFMKEGGKLRDRLRALMGAARDDATAARRRSRRIRDHRRRGQLHGFRASVAGQRPVHRAEAVAERGQVAPHAFLVQADVASATGGDLGSALLPRVERRGDRALDALAILRRHVSRHDPSREDERKRLVPAARQVDQGELPGSDAAAAVTAVPAAVSATHQGS